MAKKSTVSDMVSGLGMGLDLIQKLSAAVVKAGGQPDMLHFLVRPEGEENLKKVGELIASLPWRIPKSMMEKLAVDWAMENFGLDERGVKHYRTYGWYGAIRDILKISYLFFGEEGSEPLPAELRLLLEGKKALYPHFVEWEDEKHMLVDIDLVHGSLLLPGDYIMEVKNVGLVPARHFDFDR